MERIIQYIRIDKLFDNYIPCMKNKCDSKHVSMVMKSIIYILNKTWINNKIKLRIHRRYNIKIEVVKHA